MDLNELYSFHEEEDYRGGGGVRLDDQLRGEDVVMMDGCED